MDVLAAIERVMPTDAVHHGRLGQKWGVRNGPPYPLHPEQLSSAEKKAKRSVFISGSSKTQFEDSGYYRKELPKAIQNKIDDYIKDHAHIIVGDAPGIDRQVQDYLNEKGYDAVEIYGPGKQVRYAANDKWKTNPVDAPEFEEMSPEWLRKKDIAMTNDATEGLAIVLDNGAQATRNNVKRLREQGKAAEVFVLGKDGEDDFESEPGSYVQSSKKIATERAKKAWKTHGLVDDIINSMSADDRYKVLVGDDHYLNKEEGSHVVKRSITKANGKAASFIDLLDDGKQLQVAIGTRAGDEYRGKGYGYKAAKNAIKWYEQHKYELPYEEIVWGVLVDNYGSIRIAEKLGFEKDETSISDDGKWINYVKKSNLSHSEFLSAVELVLPDDALQYGVLGQKWGVRHWQNKDGTLTPAGRERWINSLKYEAYMASKKWNEYQTVRKQVIENHYNGVFDKELDKKMFELKKEAEHAGAVWGALRKRVEAYLENGPDVSTDEPIEETNHKVLIPVSDEEKYKHFKKLGYKEKGRNKTWIYMVRHDDMNQNDVLIAIETIMNDDAVHSGRLGMKWHVRNGPPYPLDRSQMSEREKMLDPETGRSIASTGERKKYQDVKLLEDIAKSHYRYGDLDRLTGAGRKHMEKMLSKPELQEYGSRKKDSIERSLKNAGLIKADASTRVLDPNKIIRRAADETDQIDERRKYVSITPGDAVRYDEVIERGFLAIKDRENITTWEYKAPKGLKIADADEVLRHIIDTYGKRREKQLYKDVVSTLPYRAVMRDMYKSGNASTADLAVAEYLYDGAPKALRAFAKSQLWDGASYDGKLKYKKNKQQEILDYYGDRGYDAIADVEDYLGQFQYPVILINPAKSVKVVGKHKHSEHSLTTSAKLNHSDFLEHYGIPKMKWYERNGPPYPLSESQKTPAERRAEKATAARNERIQNAGITRKNARTDVIAKGTKFVRQATIDDDTYNGRKYFSVTDKDIKSYKSIGKEEAEYTYVAKRALKVATADAVVDHIVNDILGFKNSNEGKELLAIYNKYKNRGDDFSLKEAGERSIATKEVINKSLGMYGRESEEQINTHQKILNHFRDLGYDAIVDINQSWQGMDYPVIVIDPEDSTKLKTKVVHRFLRKDKVYNYE